MPVASRGTGDGKKIEFRKRNTVADAFEPPPVIRRKRSRMFPAAVPAALFGPGLRRGRGGGVSLMTNH